MVLCYLQRRPTRMIFDMDIGSFLQQHFDCFSVSLFASNQESCLTFRILCIDIDSSVQKQPEYVITQVSVLRVAHRSPRTNVENGIAILIAMFGIGASGKEHTHNTQVLKLHGRKQRRPAVKIYRINLCALIHHLLHSRSITMLYGYSKC